MSFSQVIVTLFEILAVAFTIYCLFNEQKIAKLERKLAKKVIRRLVKRYRAKHKTESGRRSTSKRPLSVCAYRSAQADEAHNVA